MESRITIQEMGLVQARTPERIKENAMDILDKLGLNMSTYINMALNQLIIQGGIPFSVKLASKPYSDNEVIREIGATLKMEGMELDEDDIKILKAIRSGQMTANDARTAILNEV